MIQENYYVSPIGSTSSFQPTRKFIYLPNMYTDKAMTCTFANCSLTTTFTKNVHHTGFVYKIELY